MNSSPHQRRQSWALLAGLWLLLLLLAPLRPLVVPDEGRYGEIGRWMLVSGDWLTPRLNGLPFFHKPPLLYWLEAASLALFGVTEFALRVVPALHVGLMLVALYLAARAVGGERLARRAALMLGSSLGFLVGGQYVNHDMLVACWIGVAIWCFAFAFLAGDRPVPGLARWGFVACALGVLSKGLIGVALPGLVLLLWLAATRQLRKLRHLPWLSGLGLFAVLTLPWFVLVQRHYPGLLDYMFVHHQFNRYTAGSYNNPQPALFYLGALGVLFFPWLLFALAAHRRPALLASLPTALWLLCWIWLLAILLFFSIPRSKLVGYMLPVLPPLALLAALGWERVLAPRRHSQRIFLGLCLLDLVIALVLVTQVGRATRAARTEDVARVLACAARPSDTLYVSGAYPYDLPFYAQTTRAMVVLEDWAARRAGSGDGWQRELLEAADFEPATGQVLQSPQVLAAAGAGPGNWWLVRQPAPSPVRVGDWRLLFQGAGWALYQSSAGTQPPAGDALTGLPGCRRGR